MKKNAILIAGILFVAGSASQAQDSIATQHDPASVGAYGGSVSGGDEDSRQNDDRDISADSSIRGGSLEARGYDQEANNDEIEPPADPINPGKQADSSIRGGSIYAREKEWNHDPEPSSGQRESKRHLKADSSIRGGSLEARGGREAQSREDSEGERESESEFNNDASLGGAARGEVGRGESTLDDLELKESDPYHSEAELNSSEQIEENIAGEFDLDETGDKDRPMDPGPVQSSIEDPNRADTFDSSSSSLRSTDLAHDASELNSSALGEMETEASGAAASREVGTASSDNAESSRSFQSNDPALNSHYSPLGSAGSEPNLIYRENPARGVGSHATGDYGGAAAAQSGLAASMNDNQLAQEVKSRLSRESIGAYGLMSHEVARNIQVSASNGEVTLTGTVPSQKDKQMVEIRVAEIAGARGVNNQLSVTPEADPVNRDLGIGHDLEDATDQLQD